MFLYKTEKENRGGRERKPKIRNDDDGDVSFVPGNKIAMSKDTSPRYDQREREEEEETES